MKRAWMKSHLFCNSVQASWMKKINLCCFANPWGFRVICYHSTDSARPSHTPFLGWEWKFFKVACLTSFCLLQMKLEAFFFVASEGRGTVSPRMLWCMVVSPGTAVSFCYGIIETGQRKKQTNRETNKQRGTTPRKPQRSGTRTLILNQCLKSIHLFTWFSEPETINSLYSLSYFESNFLLLATKSIMANSAEPGLGSMKTGQHHEVFISSKRMR